MTLRRFLRLYERARLAGPSCREAATVALRSLHLQRGVAIALFLSLGVVALPTFLAAPAAADASVGGGADLPPRRAVTPELEEKVDELRRLGLEEARRLRPKVEAALPVIEAQTDRMIRQAAGLPERAGGGTAEPERDAVVYFTSRRCSQCTAALDLEVRAFMDLHPEMDVGVIYLGNPFTESEDAADVYLSFIGDVVERWKDRLADPRWIAFLEDAGSVKDRSARVQVRFSTSEAERLGIDRVPAFLFMAGDREVVAYGRPTGPEVLEAIYQEVRGEL